MTDLLARWTELARRSLGADHAELGRGLIARWDEPGRHYHVAGHLAAMLDLLAEWQSDDDLRLAAWYHDAIYRPWRRDNEARSAALARRDLREAGLAEARCHRIVGAVLATRRHVADDPTVAELLDADLAILGAASGDYRHYTRAVRAEYAHVPGPLFRLGRRRFVESVLAREWVFATGPARERFEAAARRNLAAELAELTGTRGEDRCD